METPKTDFVILRTSRSIPGTPINVSVIRNNGNFDFTGYSYWRTRGEKIPMEEWVPSDELELYQRTS